MVNKLIIILFFLFQKGFCQNNINDYLKLYLDKSKTAKEITFIKNNYSSFSLEYLPTISPIKNKDFKGFSSLFGYRIHPIDKKRKFHKGIDIKAPLSSVILATGSGLVKKVRTSNNGYGFQVLIEHQYGYSSRYAHMYFVRVKENEPVKKGQIIGFVGSTGSSTGFHLHYEILKNNKAINPIDFLIID